jgi:hypothetical protein
MQEALLMVEMQEVLEDWIFRHSVAQTQDIITDHATAYALERLS